MTPEAAGFFWQRNPTGGDYRPCEVRFFDDGGLLWSKPGDRSWWDLAGDEGNAGYAGWVWCEACLDPAQILDLEYGGEP